MCLRLLMWWNLSFMMKWISRANGLLVCLCLFLCSPLTLDISHSSFTERVPVCLSTRWSSLNRIPAPPSVCTRCSTWTLVTRSTATATTTTCRSASKHTIGEINQTLNERINLDFILSAYKKCVCVCVLDTCVTNCPPQCNIQMEWTYVQSFGAP